MVEDKEECPGTTQKTRTHSIEDIEVKEDNMRLAIDVEYVPVENTRWTNSIWYISQMMKGYVCAKFRN